MKKIILGLFVSVFLLTGMHQVYASPVEETITRTLMEGMKGNDVSYLQTYLGVPADGYYGPQTILKVKNWQRQNYLLPDGMFGPGSIKKLISNKNTGSVLGVDTDTTPRIMYWWGKINQHVDVNGAWQTDAGGSYGATEDKLTYCKKFWPNTISVEPYKTETIDTWRGEGNTGAYTGTKVSDKCVQGGTIPPVVTSATITVPDCIIKLGYGSCNTQIKWNVSNPKAGASYKVITSSPVNHSTVQTLAEGTSDLSYFYPYSITYQKQVFAVVDSSNTSQPLATVSPTATCATGTIWNGSSACVANDTPTISCSDSDGGLNYSTKGTITGPLSISGSPTSDMCVGEKDLRELFCNTNGVGEPRIYTCPNGCSNGVCLPAPTVTPSITVTSPNGDEKYNDGQPITVTWTSNNIPNDSKVYIELSGYDYYNNMYLSKKLTQESVLNDGSETVNLYKVPTDIPGLNFGKFFKIRIVVEKILVNGANVSDYSDSNFTILPAPIPVPVKVSPCAPYGDVDYDGYLTEKDTTLIMQKIGAVISFTTEQIKRADVNKDGNVSGLDVTLIKNYMSGASNTFPVCTVTPSITVTYPNGGETFEIGKYLGIKYEVKNAPIDSWVALVLYKEGISLGYITLGADTILPGDGKLYWRAGDYVDYLGSKGSIAPVGNGYTVEAMLYSGAKPIGGVPQWPSQKPLVFDRSNGAFTITSSTVLDTTPRIMYWSGMVNQHVDANGTWQTDTDGRSGADLDKLTYCKKFWPNTTSVEPYKAETIDTWRSVGNMGAYSTSKVSDKCVQGPAPVTPSITITVTSPNGGEIYTVGQEFYAQWKVSGISNLANVIISLQNNVTKDIVSLGKGQAIDGSVKVSFPNDSNWALGNRYKIFVSTADSSGIYKIQDWSDNTFTITSAPVISKVSPCAPYGDVDYDGYITEKDTTLMSQKIIAVTSFTTEQTRRADVNKDGNVSVMDVALIKNYMSGASSTFPVCTSNPSVIVGFSQSHTNIKNGSEEKVLSFDVSVDTSDVNVNSYTISFENKGQGSNRLSDYVSQIGVYTAMTRVALLDVSEFTRVENVYSKTIVIPSDRNIVFVGKSRNFYLTVKTNPSLDGINSYNNWKISANNIRYTLPSGFVNMSTGWAESTFAIGTSACLNGATNYPTCTINTPTNPNYCSVGALVQKLSRGMFGSQVKSLQSILASLDYLEDKDIDGSFGRGTRSAVIAFQYDNGLTPDGIVGTGTRLMLNKQWQAKCSGSVSNLNLPDLTSNDVDITPRSGQIKQRTISANIINNSAVSANDGDNDYSNGFLNRIEIYSQPNGSGSMVKSYDYLLGNLVDHSEYRISRNFELEKGSYSVRVCADSNSIVKESVESNNCSNWENFGVGESTPSITITSPNGGEAYKMGDEITVKWKTENITSNAVMSVCIKKLSGDCVVILTENDGEIKYDLKNYNQSISIPGDDYVASVSLGVTTPIKDISDKPFTINPSSTDSDNSTGNYIKTTTIRQGSGDVSKKGDILFVKYTGKLQNGTVFDSNVDPKFGHIELFQFVVGAGNVIKGWDEGLIGMKVGEIRKLEMTPNYGYGSQTVGKIPANSVLVFEVELIKINNSITQSIPLTTGWNIISFNLKPTDLSLVSMFASMNPSNGEIIENEDGVQSTYKDGSWIGGVNTVDTSKGYKVKVSKDKILTVSGNPISVNTNIPLKNGTNLVPYYPTVEMNVATAFSSVGTCLKKVMDEAGNAYENWGTFGGWKNNIGTLKPGEGYTVYTTCAANLNYNSR